MAIAHKIIVIAYHILKNNTVYQELGKDYVYEKEREHMARKFTIYLRQWGYVVHKPEETDSSPKSEPEIVAASP